MYKIFEQLLDEKSLKAADVTRATGINSAVFSEWKKGKSRPNTEKLIKISKFFGVSIPYLLGESSFKKGPGTYESFCRTADPCFEDVFDFGSLLKDERETQGITVTEMSTDLGITEGDLKDIENGVLPLNGEWAKKLASYLGTSVLQILFDHELYDGDVPDEYHDRLDEWAELQNKLEKEAGKDGLRVDEKNLLKDYNCLNDDGRTEARTRIEEMAMIPTYSQQLPEPDIRIIQYYQKLASAGTGQVVFDDEPATPLEIPDKPEYEKASYAIGVDGNSMEPLYGDGDILLIEPTRKISIGEIGIFVVGNGAYVKELGNMELISLNKGNSNIPLTQDLRCMGRVVDRLKP